VQKAYGYLTNPLTKIIYDEYGVPGLSIYEKSKIKFQDLQEEVRTLTGNQNEEDARNLQGDAIAEITAELV